MKKYQKDSIETLNTGSNSIEIKEADSNEKLETESLLESLMGKLMDTQMFEDELIELASKPITMLLPQGDKKRFYLYSPVLNMYRDVVAPVEAIIMEKSNEKETLCIINNVPYAVPNKYLKDVGYN